ncbi:hypothetical protein [Pseudomonas taiwanensis]|uniref:hypothetical protein n=1 Tax=Pseudomonas taiwanensis TaxID=470150 RepID=UPI000676236C|nr:hypothetical protein [Pseudomonas taiwanensis]
MASNMERFDLLTGAVFAQLYESFPEPVILDPYHFLAQIAPEGQDQDVQNEQAFGAIEFFGHTIDWLTRTGYLTHTTTVRRELSIFEDCVLTAKGLEVLKALPDSVTGKNFGSLLQDAAENGLLDSVKSLAGKALAVGASMSYSAAASWIANP